MTSNDLGRVGFKLLGAYLVVTGLVLIAEGLNDRPLVYSMGGGGALQSLGIALFSGILGASIGCFAPGAYLLLQGDSVADRFFPVARKELNLAIDAPGLFGVFLAIVGVWFLIAGLMGVVGGGVYLVAVQVTESDLAPNGWQAVSSSTVSAACGFVLLRWSQPMRRAA
jgi:hypothetical protein